MSETVIIGFDGGPRGEDALALGTVLGGLMGGRVIVAAVGPDAHRILVDAPGIQDLSVETRALGDARPAEALQELAESESAWAIVLGSTHRGPVGRIFPGSVGQRLLHGCCCAVAIAPHGLARKGTGEARVIGVAFDGSQESRAALETARELAERVSAAVRVFSVHEPVRAATLASAPMGVYDTGTTTQLAAMQDRLREAVAELPADLRAMGTLLKGNAAEALVAETEAGLDLLVMGSRSHGPLGRVLLGSVSSAVMQAAACPVLVLPKSSIPRPEPVGSAALAD